LTDSSEDCSVNEVEVLNSVRVFAYPFNKVGNVLEVIHLVLVTGCFSGLVNFTVVH